MTTQIDSLPLVSDEAPSARVGSGHVDHPKPSGPLFVITIRCRDGSVERVPVHEGPHGLLPAPTKVGRQIAAVLTHYKPA